MIFPTSFLSNTFSHSPMYQAIHSVSCSDLIKIHINSLALPHSKVHAGFLHRCLQIKPQLNSYHIKPWTQHGDHTQLFCNTPTNSFCRMWRHQVRLSGDITTCLNVGSVCVWDCRDIEEVNDTTWLCSVLIICLWEYSPNKAQD